MAQTRKRKRTKTKAPAELDGSIRKWLRENGYSDVCGLIDSLMCEWARKGITTRRNWWDILAGDNEGRPRKVNGRPFPVLAAAQERQGKPVTSNALKRTRDEQAPAVRDSARWTQE